MYKDLISTLQQMKVETGSFVCLGCGHEHSCSTHGCAILRDAEAAIKTFMEPWRRPEIELPPNSGTMVLVIVSGKPTENTTLQDAYQLATYSKGEGWILEEWPEATDITVTHWMPLPEPPEEKESAKEGKRDESNL